MREQLEALLEKWKHQIEENSRLNPLIHTDEQFTKGVTIAYEFAIEDLQEVLKECYN